MTRVTNFGRSVLRDALLEPQAENAGVVRSAIQAGVLGGFSSSPLPALGPLHEARGERKCSGGTFGAPRWDAHVDEPS